MMHMHVFIKQLVQTHTRLNGAGADLEGSTLYALDKSTCRVFFFFFFFF